MEHAAYEQITKIMKEENIDVKGLADRMHTVPNLLLRKLKDGGEIKACTWMEIVNALGYDVILVPRDTSKEEIRLSIEELPPLKAINRILVFSAVNITAIADRLGISRQAVSTMLKKNNDILLSRLTEVTDILEYDIELRKHTLKAI